MYVGAKLHLPVPVQGGSTLAVQLEKFRHSPNGRTDTPSKAAPDSRAPASKPTAPAPIPAPGASASSSIISITVPLAAAPGYGEIHGLGEALFAWFGMRLDQAAAALRRAGSDSGEGARLQMYFDAAHLGARAVGLSGR